MPETPGKNEYTDLEPGRYVQSPEGPQPAPEDWEAQREYYLKTEGSDTPIKVTDKRHGLAERQSIISGEFKETGDAAVVTTREKVTKMLDDASFARRRAADTPTESRPHEEIFKHEFVRTLMHDAKFRSAFEILADHPNIVSVSINSALKAPSTDLATGKIYIPDRETATAIGMYLAYQKSPESQLKPENFEKFTQFFERHNYKVQVQSEFSKVRTPDDLNYALGLHSGKYGGEKVIEKTGETYRALDWRGEAVLAALEKTKPEVEKNRRESSRARQAQIRAKADARRAILAAGRPAPPVAPTAPAAPVAGPVTPTTPKPEGWLRRFGKWLSS